MIETAYEQRYSAKRDAGWTSTRRDGSQYSAENDRQSGCAEELVCKLFGVLPNREVYKDRGDDGWDFCIHPNITVDVKWMGCVNNDFTHPRLQGPNAGFYVNQGSLKAQAYVAVEGIHETGQRILGWCARNDVLSEGLRRTDWGLKHYYPSTLKKDGTIALQPIETLLAHHLATRIQGT